MKPEATPEQKTMNSTIAEFMKYEWKGKMKSTFLECCDTKRELVFSQEYHCNWIWLHHVIDTIHELENKYENANFHVYITKRHTRVIYDWEAYSIMLNSEKDNSRIERFMNASKDYRFCLFNESPIEATHQAVYDFITWWKQELTQRKPIYKISQ